MPIAINLTEDDVTAIYHAVKSASCNNQTSEQAFLAVKNKVKNEFTEGSCSRFFRGFEAMRGGDMYKLSMGPKPTDWFLGLIKEDSGKEGLKQALEAFLVHIKHCEKQGRSHKMIEYWPIYNKYFAML